MKIYHNVDEVFSDRRSGIKLSEVIDNILNSPQLLGQIETPFDLINGLQSKDYLDTSTKLWNALPVALQIKYANAYQSWYARHAGHPDVEGLFHLRDGLHTQMMLIPPTKYRKRSGMYMINEPKRFVTIRKAWWLGKYEVTQREWMAVMHDNPSFFKGNVNKLPVETVSWHRAMEFCREVEMILPDEDLWESACRSGTTTIYHYSRPDMGLEEYAWYMRNSRRKTHNVGTKKENAWGLHDMYGNVDEWCLDFDDMLSSDDGGHIIRGGCWYDDDVSISSSHVKFASLDISAPNIGFRVARLA